MVCSACVSPLPFVCHLYAIWGWCFALAVQSIERKREKLVTLVFRYLGRINLWLLAILRCYNAYKFHRIMQKCFFNYLKFIGLALELITKVLCCLETDLKISDVVLTFANCYYYETFYFGCHLKLARYFEASNLWHDYLLKTSSSKIFLLHLRRIDQLSSSIRK